MSSKQPKTTVPTDADLKGNPGIGSAKGMTMSGGDPADLEGDSTYEGDVENDVDPRTGAVREDQLGHTNS